EIFTFIFNSLLRALSSAKKRDIMSEALAPAALRGAVFVSAGAEDGVEGSGGLFSEVHDAFITSNATSNASEQIPSAKFDWAAGMRKPRGMLCSKHSSIGLTRQGARSSAEPRRA